MKAISNFFFILLDSLTLGLFPKKNAKLFPSTNFHFQTEPYAHDVEWVNEKLQKSDEAVEEECKEVKACSMKEVHTMSDDCWSFLVAFFQLHQQLYTYLPN